MCRYYAHQEGQPTPRLTDVVCGEADVHALAGSVMAGLATLDGICCTLRPHTSAESAAFLSSGYVQTLADRYGRRPLLIALPLLATISTVSMPFACE